MCQILDSKYHGACEIKRLHVYRYLKLLPNSASSNFNFKLEAEIALLSFSPTRLPGRLPGRPEKYFSKLPHQTLTDKLDMIKLI